jgi:hypothetical protein
LAVGVSPTNASADGELLVVSYKQDLFASNPHGKNLPIVNEAGLEAACVAMALAHNMQEAFESGASETQVAVFPSLAGVKLANEQLLLQTGLHEEECPIGKDQNGIMIYKTLGNLVRDFISSGGRLVICPLCWINRGYKLSDAFTGAVLDQNEIPALFLSPGKSVDF